jgi:glycosyltransferase involved in cell wall biosynthesis
MKLIATEKALPLPASWDIIYISLAKNQRDSVRQLPHCNASKKTMNRPLVSIITPCFNSQKYIAETIESVKRQNYPHIEHIIVDGASTDGTREILRKYDGQIKWISEPDNGMYEAINKGFSMAKGEIFTYINSDDLYYSENAVAMVVEAFEQNRSIDFVYGHCAFTDENGTILYIHKAPFFNRKIALAYPRIIFHQPTCFWRKIIYTEFDTSFKFVSDSKFFRDICMNYNGKKINLIIAKFRIRSDSLSITQRRTMHEESERIFVGKTPYYMELFDLIYIRTFLNLRANLKRFFLYYQKRLSL